MRPLLLIGLLSAAGLAGCEEDVNPILGTDVPFTFYGVITPQADTQWVRVFPVELQLLPSTADAVDAVVSSVDQATGEVVRWRDTVLTATDEGQGGVNGYFYWAAFTPPYGRAYRVDVTRSDGASAYAVARVPERVEIEVLPPASEVATRTAVLLRGPAAHFLNVRVAYHVRFGGSANDEVTIVRRYDGTERPDTAGHTFLIDHVEDQNAIENLLRDAQLYEPAFGLRLRHITITLLVADPAWDPPGDGFVFDPNVLVEPEQMRNVVGGFGFLGAGYNRTRTWLPPDFVLVNAGFRVDVDTTSASR